MDLNNLVPDSPQPEDVGTALFGIPIDQAAPELSPLSDSSQMGGIDYSFYTDPENYALNQPPVQSRLPSYEQNAPGSVDWEAWDQAME